MTGAYDDKPNRIPWPPLLYSGAILIAVALHFTVPLGWFPHPFSDFLFAVGLLIFAAAIALDLYAMTTLHRARTTIWPNRGSSYLVHEGPYKLTRNPIYVGNTAAMIGFGLAFGIAWFFPLALIAAYATQKLAVEREEQHLAHHFGKPYRDYMKKVRRWL